MEDLEDSHNSEYSDDSNEKEEDVKLNQRCQVVIYPLLWGNFYGTRPKDQ